MFEVCSSTVAVSVPSGPMIVTSYSGIIIVVSFPGRVNMSLVTVVPSGVKAAVMMGMAMAEMFPDIMTGVRCDYCPSTVSVVARPGSSDGILWTVNGSCTRFSHSHPGNVIYLQYVLC